MTSKNFTISSGMIKHLKLNLPEALSTRPTKSILKQSVFNSLFTELDSKIFIECFGGTGSMGFEALSNGAKKAIFIEKDLIGYQVLLDNIKIVENAFKNINKKSHIKAYHGDFFDIHTSIFKEIDEPFILYLDPPFCIRENMSDIYLKVFESISNISHPHAYKVILEYMSGISLPKSLGKFTLYKNKKFGKSSVAMFS